MQSSRASENHSKEKIRISRQEVEILVQQEVQYAMKQKENSLDVWIKNIQQRLHTPEMNYENSIQMLQAHLMAVAQRAEQALAQIKTTPPHCGISLVQSHLEGNQTKTVPKLCSVSKLMESTKKDVERLRAENAALKAAFEDLQKRITPSPPNNTSRPNEVIKGLARLLHVKKEQEDTHSPDATSVSMEGKEVDRDAKRRKLESEMVPYPPLPVLPFPSPLPLEAANYSIPPRLKLDLALIKYPSPQLSMVWRVDETDTDAPPMDTYSIYLTTEVRMGSNQFDGWTRLGEHAAAPLPMFCLYTKYRPGYKICVCVVGKDKFGRYGPFSKVTCAFC